MFSDLVVCLRELVRKWSCEHISPIIKLCQEVWDTSVRKLCVWWEWGGVCVCVGGGWVSVWGGMYARFVSVCVGGVCVLCVCV